MATTRPTEEERLRKKREEAAQKLKGWYTVTRTRGMTRDSHKQFRCMMSALTNGQRNRLQAALGAAVPFKDTPDFIMKIGPIVDELVNELRRV